MNSATVTGIIAAAVPLVIAITGLITAIRAHKTINTEIKPQLEELKK